MTKSLLTCALAASLAVAVLSPTSARADNSGAVAAGVIGGLAVGAMVGSAAAANNGPYYSHYRPAPGYYRPVYYGCYWERHRVWDGFGYRYTRVRVCP